MGLDQGRPVGRGGGPGGEGGLGDQEMGARDLWAELRRGAVLSGDWRREAQARRSLGDDHMCGSVGT